MGNLTNIFFSLLDELICCVRYLYITGRSKEIINKGGEVISPFEIEESIMTVAKHRVKVSV